MSLRDRLRRLQHGSAENAPSSAEIAAVVRAAGTPDAQSGAGSLEGPVPNPAAAPAAATSVANPRPTASFYTVAEEPELSAVEQLKLDLHRRLIERLDLEALEKISDERALTAQIREAVTEFLRGESTPLSQAEREEIVEQLVYEITGLGPLEPFFRDPTITDILINGAKEIFVEQGGRLRRAHATFRNDAHLLTVIDRIVSRVGRRVDESSPMVDARLPDGSRVNAIIPPLALDGPVVSIRRFGAEIGIEKLIGHGAMTRRMATLLAGAVQARLNVVISGGTGSGKTTLLNALSSFIPSHERVITIEDAAELQLQQDHVVRLETRPPNVEGRGEVVARDLVRNALRMRPNRIIIGEVRGAEATDMLQAMNTGHEGSMATIHANTPRDALSRLENMVLQAGSTLPMRALREQIASTIHLIVQVARLSDGTRRVMSITEILGVEGDIITTNEIFSFRRHGMANGRVLGQFESTGIRPLFADRIEIAGIPMPPDLFDEGVVEDLPDPAAPPSAPVVLLPAAAPAQQPQAQLEAEVEARVAERIEAQVKRRMDAQLRQLEVALQASRDALAAERREHEAARQLLEAERARAAEAPVASPEAVVAADPAELAAVRAALEAAEERIATAQRQARVLATRVQGAEAATLEVVAEVDAVLLAIADAGCTVDAARTAALRDRTHALLRTLKLDEVSGVGSAYDEREHEVQREAATEEPPGRVLEVVARGFHRNGTVLRRARVVVSA